MYLSKPSFDRAPTFSRQPSGQVNPLHFLISSQQKCWSDDSIASWSGRLRHPSGQLYFLQSLTTSQHASFDDPSVVEQLGFLLHPRGQV
jgi:hypothetical protein